MNAHAIYSTRAFINACTHTRTSMHTHANWKMVDACSVFALAFTPVYFTNYSIIYHALQKCLTQQDMVDKNKSQALATLPRKKMYRARAHSNPLSDQIFDVPLNPESVNW